METADLSGLFSLGVYNGASLLGTVSLSGSLDFDGRGVLEGVFSLPASAPDDARGADDGGGGAGRGDLR